jgi:hypothetical protein
MTALQSFHAPPRLLNRDDAATYCGMSGPTFASECPVIPIKIRTRVLYDRLQIDRWIDSLAVNRPQSVSREDLLGRLDHAHAPKGH